MATQLHIWTLHMFLFLPWHRAFSQGLLVTSDKGTGLKNNYVLSRKNSSPASFCFAPAYLQNLSPAPLTSESDVPFVSVYPTEIKLIATHPLLEFAISSAPPTPTVTCRSPTPYRGLTISCVCEGLDVLPASQRRLQTGTNINGTTTCHLRKSIIHFVVCLFGG